MSEFTSEISPLTPSRRKAMSGVTWHKDIPSTALAELRILTIFHKDFQGAIQKGQLLTRHDLAEELLVVFKKLLAISFPIASIVPMLEFGGDDGLSMDANNSSCFNSRRIRGTTRLSMHATGAAVDINPVQNPVLRDGEVRPEAGRAFCQRRDLRPGMIVAGSPVISIFAATGWKWGGDWNNPVDYHHFYRE